MPYWILNNGHEKNSPGKRVNWYVEHYNIGSYGDFFFFSTTGPLLLKGYVKNYLYSYQTFIDHKTSITVQRAHKIP